MQTKILNRTVWLLALVSLFADVASELLYPVMPVYLREIGFSFLLIGILEGVAEAMAGLSKGYFGKLSDGVGARLPFVRWGYFLSAVAKPLLVWSVQPLWVFGVRLLDRTGKGLRSGARDALLSQSASPETKARVFGFHRGMDTLGAVAGPLLALLYLYYFPRDYKTLFLLAFIPGLVSVGFTLLVREQAHTSRQEVKNVLARSHFLSFVRYWKTAGADYRRIALGMWFFALINSSDAFLILRLTQEGLDDLLVIGLYCAYNLVYALASYPLGILADKWGKRRVLMLGLLVFVLVYAGFAKGGGFGFYALLFLAYGLYAAATDGVAKAWISNTCKKQDLGTAIGTFNAYQSIGMMCASGLAGILWQWGGASLPFLVSAVGAFLVFIFFAVWPIKESAEL
ncbi:MAG: MFS transporter [Saprospiraceae bacterium]